MLLLHLLEVEYLGLLEDLERVKLAIVLVLAQPHAAERARPQRRVLIQVVELQLGLLHHPPPFGSTRYRVTGWIVQVTTCEYSTRYAKHMHMCMCMCMHMYMCMCMYQCTYYRAHQGELRYGRDTERNTACLPSPNTSKIHANSCTIHANTCHAHACHVYPYTYHAAASRRAEIPHG